MLKDYEGVVGGHEIQFGKFYMQKVHGDKPWLFLRRKELSRLKTKSPST